MTVALYGYQYSVYSWIVRLALLEKGTPFDWIEIDPFTEPIPPDYRAKHPFKRVPALIHDGIGLYETGAITRYVDEAFPGPALQPTQPIARARCNQILSIIDSYAYRPLVRQVFAHRVFRPLMGDPADQHAIRSGLDAAPAVLKALESLATGGTYLVTDALSLADIHLAPIIGYFVLAEEGQNLLNRHDRLSDWWSSISRTKAFQASKPKLPRPPGEAQGSPASA